MPISGRSPLRATLLVAAVFAAGPTALSDDKAAGANPPPKEDLRSLTDEEKAKRLDAIEKEYESFSRNQDVVPVRTRRNGVTRAGDMRYPPAAKFLRKAFETDNDLTTKIAALVAIGKCGDFETIEFAVKRTLSIAPKQPVYAATLPRMFANVENQDARVWITTRMPDKEDDVAANVVEAMGEARVPEAVPVLTSLLDKSKNAPVRFEALRALGKCGGKDAGKKLLTFIADPDWRMRMGAVEALGFTGDAGLIPDIRKVMVRTEEPIVVETAVEALCRLGTKDAVEPLIDSLRVGRLRARQKARAGLRAIGKALYKSEKDYQVDPNLWKSWWEKVKKGVDPDDPTVSNRETTSYFNFPIQSDRCFFILDVSGSMEWPDPARDSGIKAKDWKDRRIDIAHRNLFKALKDLAAQNRGRIKKGKKGDTSDLPYAPTEDGLEPPTLFNVAVFSGGVRAWQKQAMLADDEHVADAIKWLEAQLPGGGTASYDALANGIAQTDIDTIFFLSDGVPSLGRYDERETILGELRKLNRFKRITINTVALIIGLSPIESVRKYEDPEDMADFMRRVAEENQGTFANESK